MAKQNNAISFSKAEINLEEGTITEYGKDSIKVYRLMDELAKFAGEGKTVDLTIKESSELEPAEVEGE